jgi:hypothetical protein
MCEDEAMKEAPPVSILVGGLVECGIEGWTGKEIQTVLQAGEQ